MKSREKYQHLLEGSINIYANSTAMVELLLDIRDLLADKPKEFNCGTNELGESACGNDPKCPIHSPSKAKPKEECEHPKDVMCYLCAPIIQTLNETN